MFCVCAVIVISRRGELNVTISFAREKPVLRKKVRNGAGGRGLIFKGKWLMRERPRGFRSSAGIGPGAFME
jgi:hypothetical protein